jgi:hypothetical protein
MPRMPVILDDHVSAMPRTAALKRARRCISVLSPTATHGGYWRVLSPADPIGAPHGPSTVDNFRGRGWAHAYALRRMALTACGFMARPDIALVLLRLPRRHFAGPYGLLRAAQEIAEGAPMPPEYAPLLLAEQALIDASMRGVTLPATPHAP